MHKYNALDSPLLRVSRPVAACSRCRAAKIKCDGKLPACTACEKTGRESECSSSNDQFAKGKERSYVASLESRVEKLERRIQYARSRKASVAMHDGEFIEPPDRKDSLATIRAAIHGKAARRREATDVNELVSDFGFLSVAVLSLKFLAYKRRSVNATARDFESSTTNMTFARLILAASINETVPRATSDQLPSRPAARALIQHYLDNVFSLYPVFPETSLFRALDAVYETYGLPATDFECWLLYMVLAIGAIGQSRSSTDAYYKDGVSWVSRALKYSNSVLAPGHLSQIQALVLLVQYSMLDPAHFDSWQLIGFAGRALVDLGFHQDPPREQQPDKATLDLRRKVFYCVYSLDRSISMVHARSFSFTDDTTSVEFPSHSALSLASMEPPFTGPHSLDSALLLFELRQLQSKWYQELFQSSRDPLMQSSTYLYEMCKAMQTWSESFPKNLSPAIVGLFQLEVLYSFVYCLAPSCRVPAVPEIGKSFIFEYSMGYVSKIYSISKDPINIAFYTYHDALRVYFIGSQFLAILSDNLDQLLNERVAYNPAAAFNLPPPPLPTSDQPDNINRSIACIQQVTETLRTYGERWSDSKALQASFEGQALSLLGKLQVIRQRQNMISHVSRSPESQGMPPTHAENMINGDWSGMTHLVQGGTILQASPSRQDQRMHKVEPED